MCYKWGIYTKQALILPLLDILGFSPYDPTRVQAEYAADFPGVKATERVDYTLFSAGIPVIFIEAKGYAQNLTNHCPQLSRYYNATPEVTVAAITNGKEWRFFTDLVNKNIMDADPFLTINFEECNPDIANQLRRFHYDELEPQALRALAEENIYLSSFKDVITTALKDCNLDFVRFVVSQSKIQRTLTGRFLESVQPIVKQAVAQSVSTMVATSLSTTENKQETVLRDDSAAAALLASDESITDPNNANIITTAEEQHLYKICCDILVGEDLQARDTETYYSIVHKGKSNRWLFRFWGDRRRPTVQFIEPITEALKAEVLRAGLQLGSGNQIVLDKPENLYRLAGLLRQALEFCKNDDNFKRAPKSVE
ncbi:type I restriction endonuclease subunit R [Advenella sp. S44]|nr:type I restriction endonuclease subunit R [Advenella sp. S44]